MQVVLSDVYIRTGEVTVEKWFGEMLNFCSDVRGCNKKKNST